MPLCGFQKVKQNSLTLQVAAGSHPMSVLLCTPNLINMLSGSLWVNTTNEQSWSSITMAEVFEVTSGVDIVGLTLAAQTATSAQQTAKWASSAFARNLEFGCTALKLFPDMFSPVSAQTEDSNGWRHLLWHPPESRATWDQVLYDQESWTNLRNSLETITKFLTPQFQSSELKLSLWDLQPYFSQ